MKNFVTIAITWLISFSATAQDITGQWNAVLNVQGTKLRLVFNIAKTDTGFSATMDSPDQGAKGIPVTKTTFVNPILNLELSSARIEYSGELKGLEIVGTFKQAGQEFPLNLSRKAAEKEVAKRPQEPKAPFGYYAEEVSFENTKDKNILAGTLTLPTKEGKFPVVILITGSGPQNRDEELLGHKPFLVIADYLTKNGIAVLRYDDRGIAKSTGDFKSATSADFATDVEAAIAFLKTRKEIDKKKIGLIGHSEGGVIAPMVAARSKDVAFIVMLAGTGIKGDKLLLLQSKLIAEANGVPKEEIEKMLAVNSSLFDLVVKSDDDKKLKEDLTNIINQTLEKDTTAELPPGVTKEKFVEMQVKQVSSPWMQYFIKFDPATTLEKVKCPVLAINGEKDLQVPPKENLTAIAAALKKAGNKNVTTKEFPNLNHLFQEATTGSPTEYSTIEQTFSPLALEVVANWIKSQTK
jgi:hypothetical protein